MKNYIFNTLRSVREYAKGRYYYKNRTHAFQKRYQSIESSLFENNLPDDLIESYIDKWKVLNSNVETDTLILCHNLSGEVDLNIVPENIFAAIIEPKLNKYKSQELSFLSVKNIYEKWFSDPSIFPKTYLHKIDNVYYDESLNVISDLESYLDYKFGNSTFPIICKPSLGTSGGEGVKTLHSLGELKDNINSYENLVFQEKIIQHKDLDKIYPNMSSIRSCLYRDESGYFKVLNNSIRFGVNGSLDNETAGGIVCNIGPNGVLNEYAVTKYCEKHFVHPDSGTRFADINIPKHDKLVECAEDIANQIPLCNLVSLDMCLDSKGNWRCIEINLTGQTIRFRQYAGHGFFGEYTDEVIKKALQ